MTFDISFDELNRLNQTHKAIPYIQYFGEMDLTDEQMEQRISLAEKLEESFLFVLALLFTMKQYNSVNWERAQKEFEKGYINALYSLGVADNYLKRYVKDISREAVDSTKRNQDTPYFYTSDRAMFMAENESNLVFNHSDFEYAKKTGKKKKQWFAILDHETRETHREVNGIVLPIDEPFFVGGSLMQHAHDASLGASTSELTNCRCVTKYF
ncbi:hypothetical protein B5F53_11880 [Blautia sp. An249]|uniref:phage minor head protein n=1 Tax=Blautia sp. An249 TaxID=1965603 RepID=UPI000B3A1630|nr:phage minor head protein [Blautia sp. An249]OUO77908.1 hypothetical protein B5F53_11880 [Blautia sp. An249]